METDKITKKDLDTAMDLHAQMRATGMLRKTIVHDDPYSNGYRLMSYIALVAAIISTIIAMTHC